ncbi:hypothetical protein CALVIDRAFT_115175 [Calocera viscosa TUFC12733]|uniref:Uncharacterized protein n=1 Tax=Calocera viscosa (strain TUFC12733) TaxID=1330018 RepID=A0A167M6J9_CALVF|nr:hypothetical protein CALVIDRAFT_115175 [Calocera viscosa TUFC12733]
MRAVGGVLARAVAMDNERAANDVQPDPRARTLADRPILCAVLPLSCSFCSLSVRPRRQRRKALPRADTRRAQQPGRAPNHAALLQDLTSFFAHVDRLKRAQHLAAAKRGNVHAVGLRHVFGTAAHGKPAGVGAGAGQWRARRGAVVSLRREAAAGKAGRRRGRVGRRSARCGAG